MSMEEPFISYRGVVYPAQCDAMGHMNVAHYVAAFDQAMWHCVLSLGYRPAWREEKAEGWADVKYVITYSHELRAGELYHLDSHVSKVGTSSLVTTHRVFQSETGQLAAQAEVTSVYFDLAQRKSRPLPQVLWQAALDRLKVV